MTEGPIATRRRLEPLAWDTSARRWAPASRRDCDATRGGTIAVATLNVLRDSLGGARRRGAVVDAVRSVDADLVLLQEMTPALTSRLARDPRIRRSYVLSDADGATLDGDGIVIASRLPITSLTRVALPSESRRSAVVATVQLGAKARGPALTVVSVHLEGRRVNVAARDRQLAVLARLVARRSGPVVVAGDFNFCGTWAQNARLDARWLDLWPALHPREAGWTVDTALSATARRVEGGDDKRVRYDRIFLRSGARGHRLVPRRIDRFATEPVVALGGLSPSDHFGLVATFAFAAPRGRSRR